MELEETLGQGAMKEETLEQGNFGKIGSRQVIKDGSRERERGGGRLNLDKNLSAESK